MILSNHTRTKATY